MLSAAMLPVRGMVTGRCPVVGCPVVGCPVVGDFVDMEEGALVCISG